MNREPGIGSRFGCAASQRISHAPLQYWTDGWRKGRSSDSPFSISHSRRAQCAKGFTLIEVLAAIALLAIAFAIALGALGKSAQNAARATALDTAVEQARSLFAEQGLMAPLKDGSAEGAFDDGMRWTLKVHMLPRPKSGAGPAVALQQGDGAMMAQAAGIDLYQIDVTVQYGAGRVLRLSTQRAQAAPQRDTGE